MENFNILNESWGVDVVMKKLRPFAKFRLENGVFTKWEDPTNSQPPTWEEIKEQIEINKKICHTLQK
jgi:hypothetical protein